MNRVRQFVLWSVIPTLSLMLLTVGLALGGTQTQPAKAADNNVVVENRVWGSSGDGKFERCLESAKDKYEMYSHGGDSKFTQYGTETPEDTFWSNKLGTSGPLARKLIMRRDGDTLKVLLFMKAKANWHYIFIPNDLDVPHQYMVISGPAGVSNYKGKNYYDFAPGNSQQNTALDIDKASALYNRYTVNANKDNGFMNIYGDVNRDLNIPQQYRTHAFLGLWQRPTAGKYIGTIDNTSVDQFTNSSDYSYIKTQTAGDRGADHMKYGNNLPLEASTVKPNHMVNFSWERLDDGQMVAVYYEVKDVFKYWNGDGKIQTFGYADYDFFNNEYGAMTFNYISDTTKTRVHGFFDSPYLDKAIYNNQPVKDGKPLPVGLKLKARLSYPTGSGTSYKENTIPNVSIKVGEKCITFKDGVIDFSRIYDENGNWHYATSTKELQDNLGQMLGREVYFYADFVGTNKVERNNLRFSFDVYKDYDEEKGTVSNKADWHNVWDINAEPSVMNTDMQEGYIETLDGKAVRVMYYNDPYIISPRNPQRRDVLEQDIRIRPYVLRNEDPRFPYNPVAISPYRNLVKWIGSENSDALQKFVSTPGMQLRRTVVPEFIDVVCQNFESWTAPGGIPNNHRAQVNAWAPGTYFADGGEWMVGDGQKYAIHSKFEGRIEYMTLKCWAEQKDPNRKDYSPVKIPLDGYVIMDSESTDGTERISIDSDFSESAYPIFGYSSCNANYSDKNYSTDAGWTQQQYEDFKKLSGKMTRKGTISYNGSGIVSSDGKMRPWWGPNRMDPIADHDAFIELQNPDGRCAEANQWNESKKIWDFNNNNYGMLFGPNLMAVAPNDIRTLDDILAKNNKEKGSWADYGKIAQAERDKDSESYVKLRMKGHGREAMMFGVLIPIDTSNADYNTLMPPVAQYSSLRFRKGISAEGEDYTLPENYNKNYYYYTSRIGLKARSYDPNDNQFVVEDDSVTVDPNNPHKPKPKKFRPVRDGSSNDALRADMVELKLGYDKYARIQPQAKPGDFDYFHKFITGVTDSNGKQKNFLGKDSKQLKEVDGKWELVNIVDDPDFKAQPLKITMPCGQMLEKDKTTDGKTRVRGWADFNGNGIFDPEEASDIQTCDPTDQPPYYDETAITTNELPWSSTSKVTITFDYPKTHAKQMNSKRNVWIRLRAVGDTKNDINMLKDDTRAPATPKAEQQYGTTAREVRKDKDAPQPKPGEEKQWGSARGSWDFAMLGEDEDYLFDITPNAVSQSDNFCVPKGSETVVFNPLENDMKVDGRMDVDNVDTSRFLDRTDKRKADPASVVFLADQASNVQISDKGKTATVKGEGVYKINAEGQITFTPEEGFKAKISQSSKPKLTQIKYAFQTKEDEKINDAVTASSNTIDGEGAVECGIKATATTLGTANIDYRWGVTKQVRNPADNTWVSEASLEGKDKPITEDVNADYRLQIKAKAMPKCISSLKGKVTVQNPTANAITLDVTSSLQTSGASGYTCTFDKGQIVDGKTTVSGNNDSLDLFYTCRSAAGVGTNGCFPEDAENNAANLVVTPKIVIKSGTIENVPGTAVRPRPGNTSTIHDQKVNISDTYIAKMLKSDNSVDEKTKEQIAKEKLDAIGVQVTDTHGTPVENGTLGGLSLDAETVIDKDGSVYVYWKNTGDRAFKWPAAGAGTKKIDNTANLCVEGSNDCKHPVKIDAANNCASGSTDTNCLTEDTTAVLKVINKSGNVELLVRKRSMGNSQPHVVGSKFTVMCEGDAQAQEMAVDNAYKPEGAYLKLTPAAGGASGGIPVGKDCTLTETMAPMGHMMLPQPIKFKVDAAGKITIKEGGGPGVAVGYEKGKTGLNDGANPAKPVDLSKAVMVEVYDPETPKLPASGGRGIVYALMMGITLMGAAVLLRRRYLQL